MYYKWFPDAGNRSNYVRMKDHVCVGHIHLVRGDALPWRGTIYNEFSTTRSHLILCAQTEQAIKMAMELTL